MNDPQTTAVDPTPQTAQSVLIIRERGMVSALASLAFSVGLVIVLHKYFHVKTGWAIAWVFLIPMVATFILFILIFKPFRQS